MCAQSTQGQGAPVYGYTTTKTCGELGEGGVAGRIFPFRGGEGSLNTAPERHQPPSEWRSRRRRRSHRAKINKLLQKQEKQTTRFCHIRSSLPNMAAAVVPTCKPRPQLSPPPALTATPRGRLLNRTRGSVSFADRKPLFIFSRFSNAHPSLLVPTTPHHQSPPGDISS